MAGYDQRIMGRPSILFLAILGLCLWPAQGTFAQGFFPSDANPLLDPGSDRRKLEDERRKREFNRIDTDQDGALSASEFIARHTEHFQVMDENRDGVLTLDEFRLQRLDIAPFEKGRIFQQMDTDESGSLSAQEYERAAQGSLQDNDIDGDGLLGAWEYRTRE